MRSRSENQSKLAAGFHVSPSRSVRARSPKTPLHYLYHPGMAQTERSPALIRITRDFHFPGEPLQSASTHWRKYGRRLHVSISLRLLSLKRFITGPVSGLRSLTGSKALNSAPKIPSPASRIPPLVKKPVLRPFTQHILLLRHDTNAGGFPRPAYSFPFPAAVFHSMKNQLQNQPINAPLSSAMANDVCFSCINCDIINVPFGFACKDGAT